MRVVESYFDIEDEVDFERMLKKLEKIGRRCYRSEENITDISYERFLKNIIDSGHESIIEHCSITVDFSMDRGISHEIVRHRIAAFTQESTRYCNYTNDKFDGEISAISISNAIEICPKTSQLNFMEKSMLISIWTEAMEYAEHAYNSMIAIGASPQIARGVLPTDLKTGIYVTFNLREWRHFFKMRANKTAHPKMLELSIPLLFKLKQLLPIVFDDIEYDKRTARILKLIA